MRFAKLLNDTVGALVMATIFFGVFTPVAFLMRLLGGDVMASGREPVVPAYWKRSPTLYRQR
jgi:hypothetical protein